MNTAEVLPRPDALDPVDGIWTPVADEQTRLANPSSMASLVGKPATREAFLRPPVPTNAVKPPSRVAVESLLNMEFTD